MFCKVCGKEIPDGAALCPYCGTLTENTMQVQAQPNNEPKKQLKGDANTYALFSVLTGIASIIGSIGVYLCFYANGQWLSSLINAAVMLVISMFSAVVSFWSGIVGIVASRKAAHRQYKGHLHTVGLILSIIGIIIYAILEFYLGSVVLLKIMANIAYVL